MQEILVHIDPDGEYGVTVRTIEGPFEGVGVTVDDVHLSDLTATTDDAVEQYVSDPEARLRAMLAGELCYYANFSRPNSVPVITAAQFWDAAKTLGFNTATF